MSNWEQTPRTTTQSKKLKWDQTPIGLDPTTFEFNPKPSKWDMYGKTEIKTNQSFKLSELNRMLPDDGYRILNLDELRKEEIDTKLFKSSYSEELRCINEDSAVIQTNLLAIKNGNTGEPIKILKKYKTKSILYEEIAMGLISPTNTPEQIYRLLKLTEKLYPIPLHLIKEFLFIIATFMQNKNFYIKKLALSMLNDLCKKKETFLIIKDEIRCDEEEIREATACILAVAKEMELIRAMARSKYPNVVDTFIRCTMRLVDIWGKDVVDEMIEYLLSLVEKHTVHVCNAISFICKTVFPYNCRGFEMISHKIMELVRTKKGSLPLLRALAYLSVNTNLYVNEIYSILKRKKYYNEIKIYDKIADKVTDDGLYERMMVNIFNENKFDIPVSNAMISLSSKTNANINFLLDYLKLVNLELKSTIFAIIQEKRMKTEIFTEYEILKYQEIIREGLQNQESYLIKNLEHILYNISFNKDILNDSVKNIKNSDCEIRKNSFEIIYKMLILYTEAASDRVFNILIENLDEINDDVISSILKCMKHIIPKTKDISNLPNIFLSLLPILKRKNTKVTNNALDLIIAILEKNDQSLIITKREWLRLIYEIIDNLDKGRGIRKKATILLGMAARLVGPQWVLNILLDTIRSNEDRSIRNTSCMGVAIIGLYCGPFNIIPSLMCDYSISDFRVKMGILKCIKYLFHGSGSKTSFIRIEYIYTLLPLLEDSLTEKDCQIRSLGIDCVKHIILSILYSADFDYTLVGHLLNYVFLSILDDQVEDEVNGVFEACIPALGVNIVYKYIIQGLYHPAQRVRKRYRQIHDITRRLGYNQIIMCHNREDNSLLEFDI
ncbi:Splicing factor 3B subunit 1 [Astathelohania contejeani]|uniref:Splicing factor 3B subunit 1 n=1 Tax=Astathelohania contejeani TaxID=164912 RepID=A0ABQ7HZ77_9MICR|nr:Splicing factor 3B subunit 1 [Thelohania contejeani]